MRYLKLHAWPTDLKKARQIQEQLKNKIILKNCFRKIKIIAAADVCFDITHNLATAAVVILNFPDLKTIENLTHTSSIKFPYVSGYFSFREAPALLPIFARLKMIPDVVLFDGQGIAHPRRMGLATHLGILLDIPTIGCAKTLLFGSFNLAENKKGSYTHLLDPRNGQIIGAALRTREHTNPIFISCGHKIDLKTALKICLACCSKFRIPQPLRLAHNLSKKSHFDKSSKFFDRRFSRNLS